jgi:hypothetical protein
MPQKTSQVITAIRNKAKKTGYIKARGPKRGGEEATRW